MPRKFILLAILLAAGSATSQQAGEATSNQPQVKVNVLNVCTPSAEEQKEIAAALERVPSRPLFSEDFEISHGRSTLDAPQNFLQAGQNAQMSNEPSIASYVRIRRELAAQGAFSSVQYSFSDDGKNMIETLVLHVRDPKDLIEISIEDSASAIGNPQTMVAANTPATRVRLERYGKSSIALARCEASEHGPAPDQRTYEPLFRRASEVMTDYRKSLAVRRTVPAELAQIPGTKTAAKAKPPQAAGGKNQ